MKLQLTLLLLLLSFSLFAQNIKGSVTDATENTPLTGATVFLKNTDKNTTTDADGNFVFQDMTSGIYTAEISFLGYEKLIVKDIVVRKGADTELKVQLQVSDNQLNTVIVNGERNDVFTALQNKYSIGVEQTLRTPAAFNDPARVAMLMPGVVNDNDLGNGLSIRGYSPDAMQWRLEGVEILNPNHLSNASSFFDQPTNNVGGTNALSSQMLGTSSLITSGFTGEHSNAVSGVMDMRLRNGNAEKRRFTAQTSLVGLDFAAEGPFSSSLSPSYKAGKNKNKASYLVNYRYSTVGLLLQMGVPLSDEKINFQDFAYNVFIPMKKSQLKIFGMLGNSSNVFKAKKDTIATERDLRDIDFQSKLGIFGASFKTNSNWESTLVLSNVENTTSIVSISSIFSNGSSQFSSNSPKKLSFRLNKKIFLDNHGLNFGYLYTSSNYDSSASYFIDIFAADGGFSTLYSDYVVKLKKYSFNLSVRSDIGHLSKKVAVNKIRTSFFSNNKYNINDKNYVAIQINSINSFLFGISNQINLNYTYADENKKLTANLFYHINKNNQYYYSPNPLYSSYHLRLKDQNNKGIEISYNQNFANGFHLLNNLTFLKSQWRNDTISWKNTFYNNRFAYNIAFGKEWQKKNKKRGVDIRHVLKESNYLKQIANHSFNDFGINSIHKITNSFDYYGFATQNYFRTDLRLYRTRERKNWSSTLSLDIQNLRNQKNIALEYYDIVAKQNLKRYQNGLIPILGWRANF